MKTEISNKERDKALIETIQTGDRKQSADAFEVLYKLYKNNIFFHALKMVNDHEISKDLTQEIFIKISNNIHKYNPDYAPSTWMFNIATNHIIDHKRKEKYEVLSLDSVLSNNNSNEENTKGEFTIADISPIDNLDRLVRKERAKMVVQAINHGIQNEQAKQIIVMIFIEDLPYEKVATQLQIPLGSVKTLMFRAKKEMKVYLDKQKEFEYK